MRNIHSKAEFYGLTHSTKKLLGSLRIFAENLVRYSPFLSGPRRICKFTCGVTTDGLLDEVKYLDKLALHTNFIL